MKILLTTLNSKYVHSNLALKYLYSVAVGSGLDITLREFTINNEMGYIYGEILRGGYDLVCFSTYIWNVEQICRLGKTLKQANPSMKIMLGGPEVSYEAAEFMEENPWADYILRGEGELGFFRFCKELVLGGRILSGLNPEKVCGLCRWPCPRHGETPFSVSAFAAGSGQSGLLRVGERLSLPVQLLPVVLGKDH